MYMQMIHASTVVGCNVIFISAHNGLIQCVTIHELDEKKSQQSVDKMCGM
jgi:hypothetical protein